MQKNIFLIKKNYQDNDDSYMYLGEEVLTEFCYPSQYDAEQAIKSLCATDASNLLNNRSYDEKTCKVLYTSIQQNMVSITIGYSQSSIYPIYEVVSVPLFSKGVETLQNLHVMDVSEYMEKRSFGFGIEELKEVQREYDPGLNSDGSCNVFQS